jgi:hypothetical protein
MEWKVAHFKNTIWRAGLMECDIKKVEYFYTTVKDQPGEAYKILAELAALGINLLAFTAVPIGPATTQLTIFPEDTALLKKEAAKAGMTLDGPHPALLVRGDDDLGALAEIHLKIFAANVNVYSASGVTDGRGSFGYIIYVKSEDYERAVAALCV